MDKGLFLIGLIAGSIFITIISKSDQALVKEYIKEFVNKADKNKLNYFNEELRKTGLTVGEGQFGAQMDVSLINDGPVTIIFDTDAK